jgi:hypothetical protein
MFTLLELYFRLRTKSFMLCLCIPPVVSLLSVASYVEFEVSSSIQG